MTSLHSMTVSVDCYVCKRLSLIGKWCHGFSVGDLLAGFCLHFVNCRLNLNPCLFTYCTSHVTVSTSCVWLKVKCALMGWFYLPCLLQPIAISRIRSSLTLNQQMHRQANMCCVWSTPCVDIRAYAQMSLGKTMRDVLKPPLHCDEVPYNIEFYANLDPANCLVGTLLMHAEHKTVY